jgi:hypothetical protein
MYDLGFKSAVVKAQQHFQNYRQTARVFGVSERRHLGIADGHGVPGWRAPILYAQLQQ